MNRQVPKVFEAIWWPHFLLGLFFIAGSSLRAAERAASAPSTNTSTKPLRLAIGGFASVGDERARAERSSRLVDLLTTRLATAAEFEVIERAEIEQVAKEAALSLSRWVKPSEAAQVGRLLRADWLLVGTFMKLGETNCVVGRIVDAQTGVVRDLTCVPDVEADLLRTVGALADFAVGSRRKGSTLEQRVFLGVGGFEDAGVNNRHPELRNDIRLKLEETFQGTTVAVVERTMVNPLLNELRLSMGGMTAPASAAPVALPAFFLVDGTYQSLYEGQQKIELLLRVEEIGGRPGVIKIKAAPGDELLGRVVAVLRSMVRERGLQSPSPANNNEALTQLERGKERARLPRSMDDVTLGGYFAGENDVKRRQNIAEAIEAFEAALLLAPDLTEAKLYLARCFLEPEIGRKDRGRDYLRELIDGNTNAALATTARRKLAESYLEEDDARALQMYSDMARDAHDPGERARIYESMYLPMERLHRRGRFAKEEGFAHLKKLLWAQCEAADWALTNHVPSPSGILPREIFGLPGFVRNTFTCFGRFDDFNKQTAEARLNKLLPPLCDEFSNFALHVLISYFMWLHYDVHTSPALPIVKRMESALEICAKNPERVVLLKRMQEDSLPTIAKWCETNHHSALLESVQCLRAHGQAAPPVVSRVLPRTNAPAPAVFGYTPPQEPVRFSIGTPVLTLPRRTTFACDGRQIWLRDDFLPALYDKGTGELTDLDWPKGVEHYITCISVGRDHVWFGTSGSGLLELDKRTRRWRQYTERDGLVLSKISALLLTDQKLWIGFGHMDSGGAGFLDLNTRQLTAFTPGLSQEARHRVMPFRTGAGAESPPKNHVLALVEAIPGEIWMAVARVGLQRYRVESNEWNATGADWVRSDAMTSLVANPRQIILGGNGYYGGVAILDRESRGQQGVYRLPQHIKKIGKPPRANRMVFSLALDGEKVWVGGLNYLALVDLPTGNVDRLAEFGDSEMAVRCLQIDGDSLWIAAEKELYRLPRTARPLDSVPTAQVDQALPRE